jgi:glycosyltransferase involved in cell wall biosynthesis
MDQMTGKRVCLLSRKPGRFYSIERIFNQLKPLLSNFISVDVWRAEYSKFAPRELLANIRAARKCRADIYHVTGDIHYIVCALPRSRTLLTIHDCVFMHNATGIKRRLLKWLLLDLPVRRCRLITTISDATKKDILEYTGCSPEKLVVIPDPLSTGIFFVPAPFREGQPRILFVGTTENKNLLRTAEALKDIPCSLDIIGPLSTHQMQALSDCRMQYTAYSGLTDEEMAERYAGADLILFPSTFEGFGLPIIEGQKAGRPVITSNLSPMKETAGGAACLVDPWDPADIRDGVLKVIRDADYRQQLVSEGFRNITRFSAETIAQQYLECYKQLLNV